MAFARPLLSGFALVLFACPALASVDQIAGGACTPSGNENLTERDAYRIAHLDASRTAGLAAALRAESTEDRATVSHLFEAGLSPIAMLPEGAYQCRTIKLGGLSDLIVYPWFKCEVSDKDGVLTLAKVSGSQNFSGTLTPAGSGLIYRGVLSFGDETEAKPYGADPERDQVGCVTKDFEDGSSFVLELPYPALESLHDVIELKR